MRYIVHTIVLMVLATLSTIVIANATPPRQWDIGIRPIDERVDNGPVRLEFYYSRGIPTWKQITLEFKTRGNLSYTGGNNIPLPIHRDSQTVWQFEVIPDQIDTSGIDVLAWIDDLAFYLRASYYFVPTEDSIIMRKSDPWYAAAHPWPPVGKVKAYFDTSNHMPRTYPPNVNTRPPDSARIRQRQEEFDEKKRALAEYNLEQQNQHKAELEQSPLADLDAQHIRVGDTIFTRKRGEQYFYPVEKVRSSSPPLWAVDTKAFLDKLLDEEKSPYHLSVACPDSACIEFLHDIADTVYLVPWSDRYQVTLNKKGLKKLRERDYKVLPGEHINTAPKQEE